MEERNDDEYIRPLCLTHLCNIGFAGGSYDTTRGSLPAFPHRIRRGRGVGVCMFPRRAGAVSFVSPLCFLYSMHGIYSHAVRDFFTPCLSLHPLFFSFRRPPPASLILRIRRPLSFTTYIFLRHGSFCEFFGISNSGACAGRGRFGHFCFFFVWGRA